MLSKAPTHLSKGTKVKGGKVGVGAQVETKTGYAVQSAGIRAARDTVMQSRLVG